MALSDRRAVFIQAWPQCTKSCLSMACQQSFPWPPGSQAQSAVATVLRSYSAALQQALAAARAIDTCGISTTSLDCLLEKAPHNAIVQLVGLVLDSIPFSPQTT